MYEFRPFRRHPNAPTFFVTDTGRIDDLGKGVIQLTLIRPTPRGTTFVFDEAVHICLPHEALLESHAKIDWAIEFMKRQAH